MHFRPMEGGIKKVKRFFWGNALKKKRFTFFIPPSVGRKWILSGWSSSMNRFRSLEAMTFWNQKLFRCVASKNNFWFQKVIASIDRNRWLTTIPYGSTWDRKKRSFFGFIDDVNVINLKSFKVNVDVTLKKKNDWSFFFFNVTSTLTLKLFEFITLEWWRFNVINLKSFEVNVNVTLKKKNDWSFFFSNVTWRWLWNFLSL